MTCKHQPGRRWTAGGRRWRAGRWPVCAGGAAALAAGGAAAHGSGRCVRRSGGLTRRWPEQLPRRTVWLDGVGTRWTEQQRPSGADGMAGGVVGIMWREKEMGGAWGDTLEEGRAMAEGGVYDAGGGRGGLSRGVRLRSNVGGGGGGPGRGCSAA
jgi:hypothetical protein